MRKFTFLLGALVMLITTGVATASIVSIGLQGSTVNYQYLILWAVLTVFVPMKTMFAKVQEMREENDERIISVTSVCTTLIYIAVIASMVLMVVTIFPSTLAPLAFVVITGMATVILLIPAVNTLMKENGEISFLSAMGVYVFMISVSATLLLLFI